MSGEQFQLVFDGVKVSDAVLRKARSPIQRPESPLQDDRTQTEQTTIGDDGPDWSTSRRVTCPNDGCDARPYDRALAQHIATECDAADRDPFGTDADSTGVRAR